MEASSGDSEPDRGAGEVPNMTNEEVAEGRVFEHSNAYALNGSSRRSNTRHSPHWGIDPAREAGAGRQGGRLAQAFGLAKVSGPLTSLACGAQGPT